MIEKNQKLTGRVQEGKVTPWPLPALESALGVVQISVPKEKEKAGSLSSCELAEARRIARELLKLYRAEIIRDADDPSARIYAVALQIFKAAIVEEEGKI
jgi:hypothetical protein